MIGPRSWPEIAGTTSVVALLADPIDHVRAQIALNDRLGAAGLDAVVVPLHVPAEGLSSIVAAMRRADNVVGLLATIPHKQALAALCDELGPNAAVVDAVNAVQVRDGRATGEIFDGIGLVDAATANGLSPRGKRVLVAGTGGAGAAVAAAVANDGPAELVLANRTTAKAEALAAKLGAQCPTRLGPPTASGHDLVINCTSLGLDPDDPVPIDLGDIEPGAGVIDIIANPEWTELRRRADDAGHPTMGGGPMIAHQLGAIIDFLLPEAAAQGDRPGIEASRT